MFNSLALSKNCDVIEYGCAVKIPLETRRKDLQQNRGRAESENKCVATDFDGGRKIGRKIIIFTRGIAIKEEKVLSTFLISLFSFTS